MVHVTDEQRLARNAYMREWKKQNKSKVNAVNQAYKDANREEVRKKERGYAAKARREKPEALKQAGAKWRGSNPAKVKAAYSAWRKLNPKYHTEWNRQNRAKNPQLYLWRSVRNRAKKEGILFSLAQTDIIVPEFCPVLGMELEPGGGFKDACPSVDRVIPERGYVPGNIVVISLRANVLKRNATPEELRKVADYAERETARVLREAA